MDAASDDGSFKAIETALKSAAWLGQVPVVYWAHDRLIPYIGNHLGISNRHGSLRQFAAREVSTRKDRGSDHNDILSKLFATQKEKPVEMDDNAVTSKLDALRSCCLPLGLFGRWFQTTCIRDIC